MIRRRVPGAWLALVLGFAACGAEEEPAVTAAKRFATAVRAGNVQDVLDLADTEGSLRLREAAQRASDQVGGRRSVEPHEMLQIVDVDPSFQVAKAELSRGDETSATVILTGADGTTHDLELVNEDGQWRVRIPAPPATTEES
jgi:hypothetical protein